MSFLHSQGPPGPPGPSFDVVNILFGYKKFLLLYNCNLFFCVISFIYQICIACLKCTHILLQKSIIGGGMSDSSMFGPSGAPVSCHQRQGYPVRIQMTSSKPDARSEVTSCRE